MLEMTSLIQTDIDIMDKITAKLLYQINFKYFLLNELRKVSNWIHDKNTNLVLFSFISEQPCSNRNVEVDEISTVEQKFSSLLNLRLLELLGDYSFKGQTCHSIVYVNNSAFWSIYINLE